MTHVVVKPTFTRTDTRGTFSEILNDGHWEVLLTGAMNSDAVLGDHYHKETIVFFFLTRGAAHIKTIDVETKARDAFDLRSGEGVYLRTGESHAIYFRESSDFIMLKSKRYDAINPDTFEFVVG